MQVLWGLLILVPPPAFNWTLGLMVFEPSAFLLFFILVHWNPERLSGSSTMRSAALIAALCLSIENLLPTYRTIRGLILSLWGSHAWKYDPFTQIRHLFAPTIPTVTVVSVVIFLVVVWRTAPNLEAEHSRSAAVRGRIAVGVASLLAFIASILAIGQLLLFAFSRSIWETRGFAARFSLRALSLCSLAAFFLLVIREQRTTIEPSDSNEAISG
jgi:hypothetical protein